MPPLLLEEARQGVPLPSLRSVLLLCPGQLKQQKQHWKLWRLVWTPFLRCSDLKWIQINKMTSAAQFGSITYFCLKASPQFWQRVICHRSHMEHFSWSPTFLDSRCYIVLFNHASQLTMRWHMVKMSHKGTEAQAWAWIAISTFVPLARGSNRQLGATKAASLLCCSL